MLVYPAAAPAVQQTSAHGFKVRRFQRFMQYVVERRLVSDARALELYPPFWWMRIKVLELTPDWRRVRVRLPLNLISRNPGGVMFGGFQAALADPIPALACARVFPGYAVWTRRMSVEFELGGRTDLELRFEFPTDLEQHIREELATRGRATPAFEYGFYLQDGTRCTRVTNTVAIRAKGYAKATSPPASTDGIG
jgi:acyl-coenzyme A thioesterase PaaI-like protein